jgi:hypothetical protein
MQPAAVPLTDLLERLVLILNALLAALGLEMPEGWAERLLEASKPGEPPEREAGPRHQGKSEENPPDGAKPRQGAGDRPGEVARPEAAAAKRRAERSASPPPCPTSPASNRRTPHLRERTIRRRHQGGRSLAPADRPIAGSLHWGRPDRTDGRSPTVAQKSGRTHENNCVHFVTIN